MSVVHGGRCGTTSPASADVVTNQASAQIQMSQAPLDKHWSEPIWAYPVWMQIGLRSWESEWSVTDDWSDACDGRRVSDGGPLVSSQSQLLTYVRRASLPFLRSSAMFFHFLTNVPAPPALTSGLELYVSY